MKASFRSVKYKMYKSKIFVIAVLIACVNSRHLDEEQSRSYLIVENSDKITMYVLEEPMSGDPEMSEENSISRVRRQAYGNIYTYPEDTSNFGIKTPIFGDEDKELSANEGVSDAEYRKFRGTGGDLSWDDNMQFRPSVISSLRNIIPNFINKLSATAKANLFHDNNHDITAQAFATRNFPNKPNVPNFNTFGGKLGYTFNNKIGATLGLAHTDLFKKTDYSAMGNLNLFKDPASSVDLNAGFRKSVSPYTPSSKWNPSVGLSFTGIFDYLKTIF